MFDELDDFASLMGEESSISKRDGRLFGAAKDPIVHASPRSRRKQTAPALHFQPQPGTAHEMRRIHAKEGIDFPIEYVLSPAPEGGGGEAAR